MERFTSETSFADFPSANNQDMVIVGKKRNGDLWHLVVDGHGRNIVIDKLREMNYLDVMEAENPVDIIYDEIAKIADTFGSGATISVVIISEEKISCYWRGDSTIKVWKGDNEIFASENHDDSSESEVKRMSDRGVSTQASWAPKIISSTNLTMVQKNYFILDEKGATGVKDRVNMTNCLGHNNKTGGATSEHHINIVPGFTYTMVVGSDGLWDVIAPEDNLLAYDTATQMGEHSLMRWEQEWNYEYPGSETIISKLGSRDDICVALWKGGVLDKVTE